MRVATITSYWQSELTSHEENLGHLYADFCGYGGCIFNRAVEVSNKRVLYYPEGFDKNIPPIEISFEEAQTRAYYDMEEHKHSGKHEYFPKNIYTPGANSEWGRGALNGGGVSQAIDCDECYFHLSVSNSINTSGHRHGTIQPERPNGEIKILNGIQDMEIAEQLAFCVFNSHREPGCKIPKRDKDELKRNVEKFFDYATTKEKIRGRRLPKRRYRRSGIDISNIEERILELPPRQRVFVWQVQAHTKGEDYQEEILSVAIAEAFSIVN